MSRRFSAPLAALALVAVAIASLGVDRPRNLDNNLAGPWPQWRGPMRNGISRDTGLLKEWPEAGPKLAWKVDGLGRGFSSVSIVGDKIFTMGDLDDGQHVIALSLADGQQIWKARVCGKTNDGGYAGPRGTPTVDGPLLYAISAKGDLVCLRSADGGEVWKKNFPKDYRGRMHSGWGYSESPLVDGDRLVCTPGGPDAMMVALDKKTGEEIWRMPQPQIDGGKGGEGAAYSSIVVGIGGGVRQYVQLIGRGVIGVAAKDGKFLWGNNQPANGTAIIPTPLVSGDYVLASSGYGNGGTVLLKLTPSGDGVAAEEQYFLSAGELQNHHGGMIMLGDYVYLGHGHGQGFPTCFDWKNNKIVWGKKRGPGDGSAALAYADGGLYFRYQNGLMALIAATPDGYQLKGKFKIPDCHDPSWPHPVVATGKLFLREQDHLYCYDLRGS